MWSLRVETGWLTWKQKRNFIGVMWPLLVRWMTVLMQLLSIIGKNEYLSLVRTQDLWCNNSRRYTIHVVIQIMKQTYNTTLIKHERYFANRNLNLKWYSLAFLTSESRFKGPRFETRGERFLYWGIRPAYKWVYTITRWSEYMTLSLHALECV